MIDQHERRCRSRMGDRYRWPGPVGPVPGLASVTARDKPGPPQRPARDARPHHGASQEVGMTRSGTSIESRRSSVRRQVGLFLAVAYALALGIALALPHAGIAPLISIAVPAVAVAVTVVVTVRPGRRRAAWAEV